ncbi:MAG: hypothetical protein KDA22_14910 [Phycisphaerales bacterium]|nr:hypothetical protein [Phycisphaerales bacterium]
MRSAPTTSSRILLLQTFALLPLGLLATSAEAQEAKVTIKVNGVEAPSVVTLGELAANGNMTFLGSTADPSGLWSATWSYSADLNPENNAVISGSMSMLNSSSVTNDYEILVEFPVCPVIANASSMSGMVNITLVMDANGGKITAEQGDAVYRVLADDAIAVQQFYGPFQMSGSAASTASTNSTFGLGSPVATPAIGSDATLRYKYQMTSGDKANIITMLNIMADPANLVPCDSGSDGSDPETGAPAGPPAEAESGSGTPSSGGGDKPGNKNSFVSGNKGVTPPSSKRIVIEPSGTSGKPGARGGKSTTRSGNKIAPPKAVGGSGSSSGQGNAAPPNGASEKDHSEVNK